MYGELSALDYGKVINEANRNISTDGFKCIHNSAGWLGYYIETPNGNKFQLVKKDTFRDTGYYLCEYTKKAFSTGKPLGLEFGDLEECKKYLILNEL